MWESVKLWLAELDWAPLAEVASNENLLYYLTHPIGVGVFAVLIAVSFFLKWRITFVILTGILAVLFVARYTMTDTGAPNETMFLFIGAAVAAAAFIIYFSLMGED